VLGSTGVISFAQSSAQGSSRAGDFRRIRTAAMRETATPQRRAALMGDADATDDSDTFVATTTEPLVDLVVTAPKVKVDGDTITVPFTVGSRGPSTATEVAVAITAPTGTTFAAVPAGCTTEGTRVMICPVADTLAPNRSLARSFQLRVTGTAVGNDGSIAVASAETDPRQSNDSVRITVEAAPALTQGRLPVTGTQWGAVAGTGAALLLLGGALTLIARRRPVPALVEARKD
jgi:hypothetical protein